MVEEYYQIKIDMELEGLIKDILRRLNISLIILKILIVVYVIFLILVISMLRDFVKVAPDIINLKNKTHVQST